jgi:hypothetical protein
MSVGIDKLVDAFMGNPAPLEAKVKKDQQGQKPGELPEDFEEALALQQINELRQGAQNQQAMQAGGAQPSIVEKLKQMLAAQQRGQSQPMPGQPPQFQPPQGQPQMAQGPQGGPPPMPQGPQGGPPPAPQGQPVMAASGGSIDQLMSNLGRHYAGGGIIAFTPGGDVEDKEKLTEEEAREIMRRIRQRTDMRPESMAITDGDFSSIPGFVAGNRFQQEMDRASGKREPMTPQQMEANVRPAPRAETQREPYSGPQQYTLQQQGADYVARKQAAREAKAKEDAENEARRQALISQIPTGGREAPASTGRMPGELERNVSNTLAAMPGASAAKGFAGGLRGLMGLLGLAGDQGEKPAAEPKPAGGRTAMVNDPRLARDFNPTPTGPGAGKAPGADVKKEITGTSPDDVRPTQPRPSASGPSVGGPAAPAAALDPNSLRALIEANIRKELGKDEGAEWAKGAKRYEDFMGIDKLLQPREARIAERQEMIKRLQGERTPAWVEALSAAGTPIRGGVGSLINMMGNKAQATRAGYSAEDLKFFDEIGAMQDEVAKLKLDGKYKAAAAGEAAIKDAIANKRQSESSGASLVATDERAEASKQIAADNRAARALTAAGQAQTAALAREEKIRQFNETELRKMREKDIDRAAKIEAAIAKRTGNIDVLLQKSKFKPGEEAELLRRRNEIVKQVKAEYPSARPEKPSESQFLAAARAANPGVSDADLKAYYKQNYGS